MHKVVMKLEELQPNMDIKVKDFEEPVTLVAVELAVLYCRRHVLAPTHPDEVGHDVDFNVSFGQYEYTEMCSPDLPHPLTMEDPWTACEIHYGINHHGSQDPDPRRQLALAILKGDTAALDLAQDALDNARR